MKKSIVLFSTIGFLILLMSLIYISLSINEKIISNKTTVFDLVQTNYLLSDLSKLIKSLNSKFDISKNKDEFCSSNSTSYSLSHDRISININALCLKNMFNINNPKDVEDFIQESQISYPNEFKNIIADKNITSDKQLQDIIITYIANTKDENMEIASNELYYAQTNNTDEFLFFSEHKIGNSNSSAKFYFNKDFNLTNLDINVK